MEEAVASNATRAAEKLRRQNLAAGRVMVFVQTNAFRPQDLQYASERMVPLPVATADTGAPQALDSIIANIEISAVK